MIIVNEHILEKAIRKFFDVATIERPKNYSQFIDYLILKKSVPAFIEALKEIDEVDFCHGFDQSKVFEDLDEYIRKEERK